MPQPGVPRDEQSIPASPFARLNHFLAVAYQVLSTNPRLLLFLGLNAAVNIVILWAFLGTVVDDPGGEPTAGDPGLLLDFIRSAAQNLPLHFFQFALLVAALAAVRGETMTAGDAFRVARARIVPVVILALLTTTFGLATQLVTESLVEREASIVSLPIVLAWLSWFAIDLLALSLVADTSGSMMAYLAGAGRLARRVWGDVLILVFVFMLTTSFLAPLLIGGVASGAVGAEPSRQAVLVVASISTIVHNIILSFIYIYGARLYIYAVTTR